MNHERGLNELNHLHRILREHYDLEELRTLCFHLGINYDDLRGEGLYAKARELIQHQHRHNTLPQLIEWIHRTRPDIELNIPPPTPQVPSSRYSQILRYVGIEKTEVSKSSFGAFRTVALWIISGSGGLASAVILRQASLRYYLQNEYTTLGHITEIISTSDFVFVTILLISILSGVVSSKVGEVHFKMDNYVTWQRYVLSAISGLIGSFLGLLIVTLFIIIITIIVFIYLMYLILTSDAANVPRKRIQ